MNRFVIALGLLDIPSTQYNFLWVEGFPLFSPEEDATKPQDRLAATHHPFTAPVAEDLPLLFHSPEKVRGQHYDLVLNGTEIGGGSIRIHSPKLQTFVFEKILKVRKKEQGVLIEGQLVQLCTCTQLALICLNR